jgi:hypothetical protein
MTALPAILEDRWRQGSDAVDDRPQPNVQPGEARQRGRREGRCRMCGLRARGVVQGLREVGAVGGVSRGEARPSRRWTSPTSRNTFAWCEERSETPLIRTNSSKTSRSEPSATPTPTRRGRPPDVDAIGRSVVMAVVALVVGYIVADVVLFYVLECDRRVPRAAASDRGRSRSGPSSDGRRETTSRAPGSEAPVFAKIKRTVPE